MKKVADGTRIIQVSDFLLQLIPQKERVVVVVAVVAAVVIVVVAIVVVVVVAVVVVVISHLSLVTANFDDAGSVVNDLMTNKLGLIILNVRFISFISDKLATTVNTISYSIKSLS